MVPNLRSWAHCNDKRNPDRFSRYRAWCDRSFTLHIPALDELGTTISHLIYYYTSIDHVTYACTWIMFCNENNHLVLHTLLKHILGLLIGVLVRQPNAEFRDNRVLASGRCCFGDLISSE